MKLEVNRAFKRRMAREKKKQEKINLAPVRSHQPKSREIRYENTKSAMAEESVIAMVLREPALLDQVTSLSQGQFSSPLLGKVFAQLMQRHIQGLEVSLSGVTDLTVGEMSHVAGILHQQSGPVSEQALRDCVRIIQSEHQSSNVESDDDLKAIQEKFRQSKGIRG